MLGSSTATTQWVFDRHAELAPPDILLPELPDKVSVFGFDPGDAHDWKKEWSVCTQPETLFNVCSRPVTDGSQQLLPFPRLVGIVFHLHLVETHFCDVPEIGRHLFSPLSPDRLRVIPPPFAPLWPKLAGRHHRATTEEQVLHFQLATGSAILLDYCNIHCNRHQSVFELKFFDTVGLSNFQFGPYVKDACNFCGVFPNFDGRCYSSESICCP